MVKMKASIQPADGKTNDCFRVDWFLSDHNTGSETKELMRYSVTAEDIKRASKWRELDQLRRNYIHALIVTAIKMLETERRRMYKTTNFVQKHIQENFSTDAH